MATIHKLELYLIDFDDNSKNFKQRLEYIADCNDIHYEVINHKESEEFEWEDDLKINNGDCTLEDYEEYFK